MKRNAKSETKTLKSETKVLKRETKFVRHTNIKTGREIHSRGKAENLDRGSLNIDNDQAQKTKTTKRIHF